MLSFMIVVMLLAWIVLAVLNFWVFQKGKHQGNLLMLIGAAVMVFYFFVALITTGASAFLAYWVPMIGMIVFVLGFFLSVQPMVQAQIDAIRKKVQDVTSDREKPQAEAGGEGDAGS